jgi:hypothetical protein
MRTKLGLAGSEEARRVPGSDEAQAAPDGGIAAPVTAEVSTPAVPARNARREGKLVMISA